MGQVVQHDRAARREPVAAVVVEEGGARHGVVQMTVVETVVEAAGRVRAGPEGGGRLRGRLKPLVDPIGRIARQQRNELLWKWNGRAGSEDRNVLVVGNHRIVSNYAPCRGT